MRSFLFTSCLVSHLEEWVFTRNIEGLLCLVAELLDTVGGGIVPHSPKTPGGDSFPVEFYAGDCIRGVTENQEVVCRSRCCHSNSMSYLDLASPISSQSLHYI